MSDKTGKKKGIKSDVAPDFISIPIEDRIREFYLQLSENPDEEDLDILSLRQAKFVSCDVPSQSTKWEFTVTPLLCNRVGTLHGGAAATLLDTLTSTTLMCIAKPGFLDVGHVSRSLNTTFLRPLPVGTRCLVECNVIATGKSMTMIRGVIKTLDGKTAVYCVHDMAALTPKL